MTTTRTTTNVIVLPRPRLADVIDLPERTVDRGLLTRHDQLVLPRRAARAKRRHELATVGVFVLSLVVLSLGAGR